MPLAPVDELSAINPAVEVDQRAFPDALAVHRTGRGRWVSLLSNPFIPNEMRHDGCPGAVQFPLLEIVVHGLPGERTFKVAPLAARAIQLEDGIQDGAQAVPSFSASANKFRNYLGGYVIDNQ